MRVMYRLGGVSLLALLFALPLSSRLASAQVAPPIGGFTGTYVPDATVKGEYEGAHGIAEGVGHVVGYAKKLFGIKGGAQDPLEQGAHASAGYRARVGRRAAPATDRMRSTSAAMSAAR